MNQIHHTSENMTSKQDYWNGSQIGTSWRGFGNAQRRRSCRRRGKFVNFPFFLSTSSRIYHSRLGISSWNLDLK